MIVSRWTFLLAFSLVLPMASGADFRVEALDEAPPTDGVSSKVLETLSHQGARVIRGTSATYCDIWLCKSVAVKADFQATTEVIYPFRPGQLIGLVRFARRGADFRDQDIDRGIYTLRYAQQPVDGAHVGTSLTRDFLLLLNAETDQSPDQLEYATLTKESSKAAQSSHPCLLSMQRLMDPQPEGMGIGHDEERDWWIVRLLASVGENKSLPLAFVISGQAVE